MQIELTLCEMATFFYSEVAPCWLGCEKEGACLCLRYDVACALTSLYYSSACGRARACATAAAAAAQHDRVVTAFQLRSGRSG